MSEFKSCVRWPEDCCPSIGNYSADTHGSYAAADGVLNRLNREGFGGDRQFFPVETWVEEKVVDVWVRVTPERARKLRKDPGVAFVGLDFSDVERRAMAFALAGHKDGPDLNLCLSRDQADISPENAAQVLEAGLQYACVTGHLSDSPQINLVLVDREHPALRTNSRDVRPDEMEQLTAFSKSLIKFMHAKGGVGLAANQLGDTRRWFVWNHGMVINPRLLQVTETSQVMVEGCLSFPGDQVRARRHLGVTVAYTDENGKQQEKVLTGMDARVFQHELDHLNGVVIVDGKTGADAALHDRQKRLHSTPGQTLAMLSSALGVSLPLPASRERFREERPKTQNDLDRIEAARLKRETKDAKRQAQRLQTQKGN